MTHINKVIKTVIMNSQNEMMDTINSKLAAIVKNSENEMEKINLKLDVIIKNSYGKNS